MPGCQTRVSVNPISGQALPGRHMVDPLTEPDQGLVQDPGLPVSGDTFSEATMAKLYCVMDNDDVTVKELTLPG